MIVYVPDPLEFYQPSYPTKTITVKLPSGGYVTTEPCEYNKLRVLSVSSTDPMDYLNTKLQPGSIISLQAQLD
ncbi:MAG: hypothetical protein GX790_01610 [Syntrophomonadaceae bacterium]|nr:hypothetical protein [Syntrophomonadaceae bacterium]